LELRSRFHNWHNHEWLLFYTEQDLCHERCLESCRLNCPRLGFLGPLKVIPIENKLVILTLLSFQCLNKLINYFKNTHRIIWKRKTSQLQSRKWIRLNPNRKAALKIPQKSENTDPGTAEVLALRAACFTAFILSAIWDLRALFLPSSA